MCRSVLSRMCTLAARHDALAQNPARTVYPGHGGDTTLGAERPHLTEWRARGW